MASKKIITVFGATGAQGGSVAQIFLNDAKLKSAWTVRAVTRDTTKESAKKLESQGAQVVAGDLNEKSTIAEAVSGAYAVYAVTNYWEKMDHKLETQQGKNIVDAAKAAGVQHFIWSSLPNVAKLTNGKLSHVYHFDSKAEVEEYARQVGIPSTFFQPGFYMSNLPGGMLRPTPPDNSWALSLPVPDTAPIPIFDTADTGKFVKAAVLNRDRTLGKQLLGATAYRTGGELLAEFAKLFPEAGKTARYNDVPQDQYRQILTGQGMPDFAAEEMLENMLLLNEGGYYGGASLDETHALLEDKLTSWEEHLKKSPKLKDVK